MSIPYPVVLTTGQLARCLAVSRRTMNKWVDEGRLPGYRIPGNHPDRRIHWQHAWNFARQHDLPLEALEEWGRQHGANVLFVPILLIISPTVKVAPLGAVEHFQAVVAISSLQSGLLLAQRTFSAVVIDSSLGTPETGELLQLLSRHWPKTLCGVIAREDEDPDRWLAAGARVCWQWPCDWARLGEELHQAMQGPIPKAA
jgi:excisionase family DNA binding protein